MVAVDDKGLPMTDADDDLGFFERFIGIFSSPRRAFESVDRRPTWLGPFLIVLVLTLITTQLSFPIIVQNRLEMLRNNPNIPAEQMQTIEEQLGENLGRQRIITLISQLIFFPISYFVLSGIFFFVGSVLLGGEVPYKKVLAVFSWAGCISVLAAFVNIPLVMIKRTMHVSLSPALFLSSDAVGTTVYRFLSNFDFFTIWWLAVFAIGFAVVYKFSTGKALVTVGALWGIWIAFSTALGGVLSQFGM